MGIALITVGSAACLAGVCLLLFGMGPASKYLLIKRAPLTTLAALHGKSGIRSRTRVALSGIAETERDLIAPGSRTPCVYFRHQVDRRLQVEKFTDMANPYLEHTWDRLHDWSASVPFRLVENGFSTQVNPWGASFVAKQVLLEDESAPGYGPNEWSPEAEPSKGPHEQGKKAGVCRVSEWVIPTEHQVYLFGVARLGGDRPSISGDPGPLIISHFPREETLSEFRKGYIMLLSGLGMALVGLLMSLIAVMI